MTEQDHGSRNLPATPEPPTDPDWIEMDPARAADYGAFREDALDIEDMQGPDPHEGDADGG